MTKCIEKQKISVQLKSYKCPRKLDKTPPIDNLTNFVSSSCYEKYRGMDAHQCVDELICISTPLVVEVSKILSYPVDRISFFPPSPCISKEYGTLYPFVPPYSLSKNVRASCHSMVHVQSLFLGTTTGQLSNYPFTQRTLDGMGTFFYDESGIPSTWGIQHHL